MRWKSGVGTILMETTEEHKVCIEIQCKLVDLGVGNLTPGNHWKLLGRANGIEMLLQGPVPARHFPLTLFL